MCVGGGGGQGGTVCDCHRHTNTDPVSNRSQLAEPEPDRSEVGAVPGSGSYRVVEWGVGGLVSKRGKFVT